MSLGPSEQGICLRISQGVVSMAAVAAVAAGSSGCLSHWQPWEGQEAKLDRWDGLSVLEGHTHSGLRLGLAAAEPGGVAWPAHGTRCLLRLVPVLGESGTSP